MRPSRRIPHPARELLVALLLATVPGASPCAAQEPSPVDSAGAVAHPRHKQPAVAFALGALVPGLGHVYAGEDDRGNTIAAAAVTPIVIGGMIELAAAFSQVSCSMPYGSECRDTRRADRTATVLALIGAAVWAFGAVDAIGAAGRANGRPHLRPAAISAAPVVPRVDRPGPVAAPAGVAIFPGARVRIDAPSVPLRRTVFGLAAQHGDTLLLARALPRGVETMTVQLEDVARLDVSRGRGESARRGALVGALVGAVAGGATGYASPAYGSPTEGAVNGARLWGGLGALLGAAVGAVVLGERWTRVVPARAP